MRRLLAVIVIVGLAAVVVACGDDDDDSEGSSARPELTAEQRADPALVTGESVYADQCARCHGVGGRGLNGPALVGIEETYPDLADQIAVIEVGRSGMPAFGARLSADDIEAVARYEREVL